MRCVDVTLGLDFSKIIEEQKKEKYSLLFQTIAISGCRVLQGGRAPSAQTMRSFVRRAAHACLREALRFLRPPYDSPALTADPRTPVPV